MHLLAVSKPKDQFLLTGWKYDCPVALDVFWKSVKEDILDIVKHTQQVSMA